MTRRAAPIAALALALSACGEEPTLLDDPSAPFPDDLASVGVYPDVSDLAVVDPRAVASVEPVLRKSDPTRSR